MRIKAGLVWVASLDPSLKCSPTAPPTLLCHVGNPEQLVTNAHSSHPGPQASDFNYLGWDPRSCL